MTAVMMKDQCVLLPKPAAEHIVEVIDSDSDEEIQEILVKLTPKQKTDNLFREAISFYREQNYESAMGKLEQIFALDPNNIKALVTLGSITYRLDEHDKACEFLTRALNLDPYHLEAITAKAAILANDGDWDESVELLENGIIKYQEHNKERPSFNEDSIYKKAVINYIKIADVIAQDCDRDGNTHKAIKWYEKLKQIDPNNAEKYNKYCDGLKRKVMKKQKEVVYLSSDEEDVKEENTEISRDILRDVSDDDQEEVQKDDAFENRVSQFLKEKELDRSEGEDLSEIQKNMTLEKQPKIEPNSEEQGDKCDKDTNNLKERERINVNEIDDLPDIPNTSVKNSNVIERPEIDDLNTNFSPEKKISSNRIKDKAPENASLAPTESIDNNLQSNNLQSNLNSLNNEFNNDKVSENIGSENCMKKIPRKRKLPPMKRLPIDYMIKKNQAQVQQGESCKIDQTQSQTDKRNDEDIDHSQDDRIDDKESSKSHMENNINCNMIDNETEYSGDEHQSMEEALFDRGKTYEGNEKVENVQGNKTDRNNGIHSSKIRNTHESKDTEKNSRKHKNNDKNRDKKNEKDVPIDDKKRTQNHEKSNENNEDKNKEKSRNRKRIDTPHQRSSKSRSSSSKLTPLEQKKKGKRNDSKNHLHSDVESDVENDVFGINANNLNLSRLDDLPDIETNHTEDFGENEKHVNTDEEEYDELKELQKEIESSNSIEEQKSKEKVTENQKRRPALSNVKKTCDLLERFRQENEKTTKDISNRLTRETQRNTAKSNTSAKDTDGRRAILLADPIVPPSEIRKRRRRRNGNFQEEEEETPKKKYVRKSVNSESPSEAIARISNVQDTPILSTPVKEPSAEIQTPTPKPSSSSKKETLTGPRAKSKDFLYKALHSRYVAVKKEFKHLDEGDIEDVAENIEAEIYSLFNGDAGKEYKAKLRSLHSNISNAKNDTLFRKILNRKLSPKRLVRMDKKELAPEQLARWTEMREKQTLDAIVETEKEKVNKRDHQVILKTHKGELEIQNDYGKEALETLNELPEDLSIELNIKSSSGSKNKKEKKHRASRR